MMENAVVISTVVQGVATGLLVIITWRYVVLTKRLVDLQIEPRVDIEVPEDVMHRPSGFAKITNRSGYEVDNLCLLASVGYRERDGSPSAVFRPIDSQAWDRKLKPKESVNFNISQYFSMATEIAAELKLPSGMEFAKGIVLLSVSFRRSADGKEFCFEEPYSIIPQENGAPTVSKGGPRKHVDSLERYILRRKKG